MVLCRRPHHRRTAYIDVLDDLIERESGGAHRLERIEVHHDKVDRIDAILLHNGVIDAAPPEEAPVDLRVEGLHPPVHHLRKPGVGGDVRIRNPGLLERSTGTAGAQYPVAMFYEHSGEIDDARFIPD